MSTVTHSDIRSVAERIVLSVPSAKAVVLYGSRARGTARQGSDWDLAVLAPGNLEKIVRKRLPEIEHVKFELLDPEELAEQVNYAGSFAFVVARDGQLLAGEWKRPSRKAVLIAHNRFVAQMCRAARPIRNAIFDATIPLAFGYSADVCAAARSQKAAEMAAKSAFLVKKLDPVSAHDLGALARQYESHCPGHPRVQRMRGSNGNMHGFRSSADHVRKPMVDWEAPFPEDLHTSVDRAVRAVQLHLEVFQAYMEDHPGHGNYALRISRAVRIALISMRRLSHWKHIPEYARRAFGDWAAGTTGIEERTGSSTHK